MALRTFINSELENLEQGLKDSYDLLRPDGRIVVLSFQGLEDIIIKKVFRELKKAGAKILTKNVVRPTSNEIKENPSARSAKLRALAKPTE
jgi:16S rRNA (cytosine1402-N4)-methyltransferase